MFTILYRYRSLTALMAAIAVGAGAIAVLPATGADFAKTATSAAMPGGDGTQNPFIDRQAGCHDCPKS